MKVARTVRVDVVRPPSYELTSTASSEEYVPEEMEQSAHTSGHSYAYLRDAATMGEGREDPSSYDLPSTATSQVSQSRPATASTGRQSPPSLENGARMNTSSPLQIPDEMREVRKAVSSPTSFEGADQDNPPSRQIEDAE